EVLKIAARGAQEGSAVAGPAETETPRVAGVGYVPTCIAEVRGEVGKLWEFTLRPGGRGHARLPAIGASRGDIQVIETIALEAGQILAAGDIGQAVAVSGCGVDEAASLVVADHEHAAGIARRDQLVGTAVRQVGRGSDSELGVRAAARTRVQGGAGLLVAVGRAGSVGRHHPPVVEGRGRKPGDETRDGHRDVSAGERRVAGRNVLRVGPAVGLEVGVVGVLEVVAGRLVLWVYL